MFVRKLDNATWWDMEEGQNPEDLGSDSLKNARSVKNELSVYQYDNDEQLELTLAVLAGKLPKIKELDFCTFSENVFELARVDFKPTDGKTGCNLVDTNHHDLFNLTAPRLATFVCVAAAHGEISSLSVVEVFNLITKFRERGILEREVLHIDIRDKF